MQETTGRADRPNILFLMTDQQRHDALGCANGVVRTPNIDALAARGVRYSQAVCNAPLCVPSRYATMLGLYPSQTGVRHNTQMITSDVALPEPVLAQRLLHQGYQTAGFGKTHWYIGSYIMPDITPELSTRGFEERAIARAEMSGEVEDGSACMQTELPTWFELLEKEAKAFGPGGESPSGYVGALSAVPAEYHRESWLTDKALRFLRTGRHPDKPFFMYLSFDFPHVGLNVPEGYEELYDINDIPDRPLPPGGSVDDSHAGMKTHIGQWREAWEGLTPMQRRLTTLRYYALCSYTDELFGRVLNLLEEQGELDNTFIVFASDHGEMLGDRVHRFSKYCLYEGSVRVPLVIAGPGIEKGRQGTVDESHAELVDVMPTLLEVAGVESDRRLPGSSLLESPARPGQFCEFHGGGYESRQQAPAYMWRTSQWKLILHNAGDLVTTIDEGTQTKGELYHLSEDPDEWYNRFDDPECAAIRLHLTEELLMYIARCWARYPFAESKAEL